MSTAKLTALLDAGAEVVGGVCYLDKKEVGHWSNGEFYEEPGMAEHIALAKKHRMDRQANQPRDADTSPHQRAQSPEDVLSALDNPPPQRQPARQDTNRQQTK